MNTQKEEDMEHRLFEAEQERDAALAEAAGARLAASKLAAENAALRLQFRALSRAAAERQDAVASKLLELAAELETCSAGKKAALARVASEKVRRLAAAVIFSEK